jgi:hypothetical protein
MCDVDRDNFLNQSEFILAMHLIVGITKKNLPQPTTMPVELQQAFHQMRGSQQHPLLQQEQLPPPVPLHATQQPQLQQPPPPQQQQKKVSS